MGIEGSGTFIAVVLWFTLGNLISINISCQSPSEVLRCGNVP